MQRALWAASVDRAEERELLNPPESARTYSGGGEAGDNEFLSVLGSTGEWKVVSQDHSRRVALDLSCCSAARSCTASLAG